MQAFLGMRGSSSHADSDFRPKNWREKILRLYPNGQVSLTALTALMKSESTDDPEFYWFDKALPSQRATVTARYTDAAESAAYASGAVEGDILYLVATASYTGNPEFRVGHTVMMGNTTEKWNRVVGEVVSVTQSGTTLHIAVKLLEADDNGTSTDLSDCTTIVIIGNWNSEGAEMPDALAYDPTKHYNYTQIFRTPLSLTRTRIKTKVRYGSSTYQEAKRDILELHGIEMEKGFLFGIPYEGTGANGQPKRMTGGLFYHVPTDNVMNYVSDSDFSGKTWLQAGHDWMNKCLELLFRYGSKNRTCYCGSGVLLELNKLVESLGDFALTTKTLAYGIQVTEWVTPFGSLDFYTHPLFTVDPVFRYVALAFDPSNLRYRYIDDTMYKKDDRLTKGSYTSIDGIKEEYLTECGLEVHHTSTMMALYGWGSTNTA